MKCLKCKREITTCWCHNCSLTTTAQILQTAEAHPDWKYLGSGRHREVWRLPSGNVLKMPRGLDGKWANEREAKSWIDRDEIHERDLWKLARCRLIPGTSILVMEYIRRYYDCGLEYHDLPKWAQHIDCAQVGYNRKGELVAFDYAEG